MTTFKRGRASGQQSSTFHVGITINGVTREFPAQVTGFTPATPTAGQAQDQRVNFPGGNLDVIAPEDQETLVQQFTINARLSPHSVDYQAIADLAGTEGEAQMWLYNDELELKPVTSAGNTVAIDEAFVAAFAGTSHPSSVPQFASIHVGGDDYVIEEIKATGETQRNASLNLLTVRLGRQGQTSADPPVYKRNAEATLDSAVAASPYSVNAPATRTPEFGIRIISCPRAGAVSGGGQGDFMTGDIQCELTDVDFPNWRLVNAPTVS